MKNFRFFVSALLIAAVLLSFGGCFNMKIAEPDATTQEPVFNTIPDTTAAAATDTTIQENTSQDASTQDAAQTPSTQTPATQAPVTSAGETPATAAPVTQAPSSAQTSSDDPSGWSKEKIVEVLGAAVNKSKAYKGELDVDHSESFVAEVTSITGGQVFAGIASKLIGLVTKPTNEKLHYVNGTTTNSEGETVPILLPKRNEFCLTPDGVAEATAVKNAQGTLITIKLVKEVADILDIPKYHSQCMGYLDVTSLNVLSMFDTYQVTFTYPASTITAQINADGNVSSVTYFIPLHFEGSGSKGILKGEGVFDGSQTEVWTLNW